MRRTLFIASTLGLLALAGLAQVTAPPVQLTLSVSPPALFVNQEGTITLRLSSGQAGERAPTDLFLVIDRSATANIREMERIGSAIVESLSPQDRVGLVSFGTDARLDVPLTFDHEAVRQGLKLLKPLGKTAVGEGIAKALDALIINGREEAAWAMVLVSDGRSNTGRTPLSQAQRAAESGVSIFTVATGRNPDRTLLRELARLTQGQFFEQFTDTVPREIAQALGRRIAARQIKITLVLPAFLSYGVATFNAPNRVTKNPDNTTTLLWELDGLSAGETWEASFTVNGSQTGTALLKPAFSYLDTRGRLVTPTVPSLSVVVRDRNRPPTANFDVLPAEPKANEPITFIDRSTDDVGIAAWEWDFGDGTRTAEQNPVHRYSADGSYTVTLTVTDTDGEKASATRSVKVFTPRAIATRTIDTNLPNDETIAGERVKVKITIQVLDRVNGLALMERFPRILGFNPIAIESSILREPIETGEGKEAIWVFLEALEAGAVRTIEYELTLPEEPAAIKSPVIKLSGSISSALPSFEMAIAGETEIKVVNSKLPMPIVFARMDVRDADNPRVDLWLDTTTISFEQIQVAVSKFWISNSEVLNKPDGKVSFGKIDLKSLQTLVAYWLTGASVFGPLP